jgi:putative DNA primase/helicase
MSADFRTTLEAAGLRPRDIVADGRIRRCDTESKPGRRNGWYVLNPDGHGAYGDWASGSGDPLGHWRDSSVHVDTAAVARMQAMAAKNRERDRAKRIEAMRKARHLWSECEPYRVHPYIEGKGLSALGCHHFRLWKGTVSHRVGEDAQGRPQFESVTDTWLVVPMYWRDRLVSLQRISSTGLKLNFQDAPTKGVCLVLGRPRHAVTVLCEGPATALAIYQCVRNARVVMCFVAGNLLNVAQELKPTGNVIVCGDNDHGTLARRGFNPGIDKAKNAAELIGAGVVWPEGIEGTDYADMLRELGPMGAKRIERLILGASRYVPREAPA